MIEMPSEFDSVFRYIVVVSQRAEQLINGARARAESRHSKPTLAAKDDVDAGLVPWRILTQEELDAQRQALVDQFRAEMGGEEQRADVPSRVPDLLPTAAIEGDIAVPDDEDRDIELVRLQRLLGMGVGVGDELSDDEEGGKNEDADDDGDLDRADGDEGGDGDEEEDEIAGLDLDLDDEDEGISADEDDEGKFLIDDEPEFNDEDED